VWAVFHAFSFYGVSGVVVIAESHVAVHTWPEHGIAVIDAFSCSERLDFARLTELLRVAFGATEVRSQVVDRARIPGAE
jgi:S-adenosylmethionine decarboxylase proenzyme